MVVFEPVAAREFDAVRAAEAADTYQVPRETIDGCRQSE